MEVDISARPSLEADSSNYALSSFDLQSESELNKNQSENGSEINISLPNVSFTLMEAEENLLKNKYAKLNTIHEESTVPTISIIDESNCSDETTNKTNDETVGTAKEATESIDMDDTVKNIIDEQSFFKQSLIEVGRRLWKSTQDEQHYTKGCLWSPDGTCILVPVHLDGMHIMELPRHLYNMNSTCFEQEISELPTAVHVKEGGTVYDYAWYPFMNSNVPESCCWLATRQHEPIHLWDAFNGELRCSYRGYDAVDEVESAISVIFSNSGEKVIGGYKKSIKIFDTNVPGRDYDSLAVKKAVACFAFTTQSEHTVTAGSWNGYIDHYDLRARQIGSLFTLGGHDAGITWLKYSQNMPLMLFSGARRDNKLFQWDMRNYKEPYRKFARTVTTNQRIYFDLSPQEEWLISGDCDGMLRIWNLKETETEEMTVPIHSDCCNGVSFHPTLPIIATSSGQYHFVDVENDADLEKNDCARKLIKYENSVVLLALDALTTNKKDEASTLN